jgi:hypothetical protein
MRLMNMVMQVSDLLTKLSASNVILTTLLRSSVRLLATRISSTVPYVVFFSAPFHLADSYLRNPASLT